MINKLKNMLKCFLKIQTNIIEYKQPKVEKLILWILKNPFKRETIKINQNHYKK